MTSRYETARYAWPSHDATSLRRLRESAGFPTARMLAESLAMSPTTYSRYERRPWAIPIKPAWLIADRIGCDIDAVVGRTVLLPEPDCPVQAAYDRLSEADRRRVDEFFEYLAFRRYNALEG